MLFNKMPIIFTIAIFPWFTDLIVNCKLNLNSTSWFYKATFLDHTQTTMLLVAVSELHS